MSPDLHELPRPSRLLPVLATLLLLAVPGLPCRSWGLPLLIHHEGLLLDDQDLPLEGTVTLQFSLYDRAVGGEPLWQEQYQLDLLDGYYSVQLGSLNSLAGLFSGEDRYLGIRVNEGAELPRQPLVSVPHALVADNAVGDITPRSITVGGVEVIDGEGNWVGPGGAAGQDELQALRLEVEALEARVAALENGAPLGDPGTLLNPALSCKALQQQRPMAASGLYYVNPLPARPELARQTYCNMADNGGGWTLAAVMRGGSLCHITVDNSGDLSSPAQNSCAKLSDEVIRNLYTDQFWLRCGTSSPDRFGRIDSIANFHSDPPIGNKRMTWSMTYGGATYTGTDNSCCNFGDHDYHSPQIIYSIAKSYPSWASHTGCYNVLHGWNQNGLLYVR